MACPVISPAGVLTTRLSLHKCRQNSNKISVHCWKIFRQIKGCECRRKNIFLFVPPPRGQTKKLLARVRRRRGRQSDVTQFRADDYSSCALQRCMARQRRRQEKLSCKIREGCGYGSVRTHAAWLVRPLRDSTCQTRRWWLSLRCIPRSGLFVLIITLWLGENTAKWIV